MIVGSFIWGNSKTKNKMGESVEGAGDSERQTVDHPITTPTTVPASQNLTPASSMGVWPGSRQLDMRNSPVDIDLMRG